MSAELYVEAADGHQVPTVRVQPTSWTANVITCHGITADRDEYMGALIALSQALAASNCRVTRFDYRGHGRSALPSTEATIAGETLDLVAVAANTVETGKPTFVVAVSFGALSLLRALQQRRLECDGIVLWNPVLDVYGTFILPGTAWSRGNLGANLDAAADLGSRSYALDGFPLGEELIREMIQGTNLDVPISVETVGFHGSDDALVPEVITRRAFVRLFVNPGATLKVVAGVGHGFGDEMPAVIQRTVDWIAQRVSASEPPPRVAGASPTSTEHS